MKKLILIFALVAVYGISVSNVSAKINSVQQAKVMVTADDDNFAVASDEEKDKKKTTEAKKETATKACCSEKDAKTEKATPATGCSESQKKSCAASQKSCCGEKK